MCAKSCTQAGGRSWRGHGISRFGWNSEFDLAGSALVVACWRCVIGKGWGEVGNGEGVGVGRQFHLS